LLHGDGFSPPDRHRVLSWERLRSTSLTRRFWRCGYERSGWIVLGFCRALRVRTSNPTKKAARQAVAASPQPRPKLFSGTHIFCSDAISLVRDVDKSKK
jgi:hypothetical protein